MKRSSICWYAAQIKYQTEKRIKEYLEQRGIEHYIPVQKDKLAISRLVFIHADYPTAYSLPIDSGYTFNYINDPVTHKFKIIPDKQMRDFILLQSLPDSIIIIENVENTKTWERVRVIKGEFAGIEGELIRIKGHKRVVIRIDGLCSLATSYIPKEYLEKVEMQI
jgi:transcription antitermination factor NusG